MPIAPAPYAFEIGETVVFNGDRIVCNAQVTARRRMNSTITGLPLTNIYDITIDGGSLITCFEPALRPAYRTQVSRGSRTVTGPSQPEPPRAA